jgi:signal transduction histidine kinase/HAMP domain-containing protein
MARRPRFSIPTRIFLGFVLALSAFGAVAALSVVQHDRTVRTLRLLHEGYLPLALTVGEARATQAVFATLLDRVLQERDHTATRSWLATARRVRPATVQRALAGVQRAQRLEPSSRDDRTLAVVRESLEHVDRSYVEGDARYNELFRALELNDETGAEAILADLRIREQAIQGHFREAWKVLQERIAETSAHAAEREQQSAWLLGVLTLLALAIGVAVTWWSQRVLKPLPRLHQRVQAVARGDLSRRLEPTTDDELGRLTGEFERMVDALATRDARLREAAQAQRQLQRTQEQIVSSLRAAVVVVDGDGVVRMANPAAAAVLELEEEAVGQPFGATGLGDRLEGLPDAVARVADGGAAEVLSALPLGGTERSVTVLATPFGDEVARGRRPVLLVAEDVTDELETKARLIQTERLAAIGKMAAHVTHEVRNPLSSIGLNVEMLADELEAAGPEAEGLLRAIQREVDRLTGITEEYLRLARLPAPRLEAEDLTDLVRQVVHFVEPDMRAGGVVLEVDVPEHLPPVALDESQLRQALLNLLRNAQEAMPGGGRVRVAVQAEPEGVRVRVSDRGSGIAPEHRERIFDLFYTTKERGTGLGLPLTQQIVVAHGGTIRCMAEPAGGTTFELRLPWVEGENEPSGPSSTMEAADESAGSAGAPGHVGSG